MTRLEDRITTNFVGECYGWSSDCVRHEGPPLVPPCVGQGREFRLVLEDPMLLTSDELLRLGTTVGVVGGLYRAPAGCLGGWWSVSRIQELLQ